MTSAAFVPERWRRMEELFNAAIDLPKDQRDAYLRESCGADDQLRVEVISLLESDGQESPLITGIIDDATEGLLDDECGPPEKS